MSTIRCLCGLDFTFSEKDKEFYEEKGYPIPRKCPKCRATKKLDAKMFTDKSDHGSNTIIDYIYAPKDIIAGDLVDSFDKDALLSGGIRLNSSILTISFKEVLLWFNDLIYDLQEKETILEINNSKYKNVNGVYMYIIHRSGEFARSKGIALQRIVDNNTLFKLHDHFYNDDIDYVSNNVWIDIKNNVFICFGEDNIRKLYMALTEERYDTLSAKLKCISTVEMKEILQTFNSSTESVTIFNEVYPADSRTLLLELMERERSFRGL